MNFNHALEVQIMGYSIYFNYINSNNELENDFLVVDVTPMDGTPVEELTEAEAFVLVRNYLQYHHVEFDSLAILAVVIDPIRIFQQQAC